MIKGIITNVGMDFIVFRYNDGTLIHFQRVLGHFTGLKIGDQFVWNRKLDGIE